MFRQLKSYILISFFLSQNFVHAQFIKKFPEQNLALDKCVAPSDSYIVPNEKLPVQSKKILDRALEGVLVSVGTERGFITAALAKNVTHLLLVDNDPCIGIFNAINIALLKAAKDRNDYLNLKTKPNHEKWKQRALDRLSLDEYSKNILLDKKLVMWFNKFISLDTFKLFVERPGSLENKFAFLGANYLYDDTLFSRVQELAKNDFIQTIELNLKDHKKVTSLVSALKNAQLKISILDISNAWQSAYIGLDKTTRFMTLFKKVMYPNSIILLTNQILLKDTLTNGKISQEFGYLGFLFSQLKTKEKQRKFKQYLEQRDFGKKLPMVTLDNTALFNPHISNF